VGAGLAIEDSLAVISPLGLKFQCHWRAIPNLIFNNKLKELKSPFIVAVENATCLLGNHAVNPTCLLCVF
jgi:hypothetical protein